MVRVFSIKGGAAKLFLAVSGVVLVAGLGGCASTSDKPKPLPLSPNPGLLGVKLAWSFKMGTVDFPLEIKANGNNVTVASSDGLMGSFDARTGAENWRAKLNTPLSAGVGSDGRFAAVVTRANELVVLDGGREAWRQPLRAQGFTAPLVAGARVFVVTADRSVSAFDVASGQRLWTQQRASEALVLRQSGVLMAVGNTLVVGQGGKLVGMNPDNGSVVWEVPIANSRGTNDIERLVDIVERVARNGNTVCARAFGVAVGCIDAAKGAALWIKPDSGSVGVHGDDKYLYGVENDGTLVTWRLSDGQQVWTTDRLRYRQLTAPLAIGRSVAVGDENGWVHMLSREDGSLVTRLATDATPITVAPVLAAGTLVVVTQGGGVYGFKPE